MDGLVEEIVDGTLDEEAQFRIVSGEEDAGAHKQRDARTRHV